MHDNEREEGEGGAGDLSTYSWCDYPTGSSGENRLLGTSEGKLSIQKRGGSGGYPFGSHGHFCSRVPVSG